MIGTKLDLQILSENWSDVNYWEKHYLQIADIDFEDSDFEEGGNFYNNGNGWITIGGKSLGFKDALLTTEVPCKANSQTSSPYDGEEYTTLDKVFLPSQVELNGATGYNHSAEAVWTHFEDADNAKRVAQEVNGDNWVYWTRSPYVLCTSHVRFVLSGGSLTHSQRAREADGGVRPALNLKSETPISGIPGAGGAYEIQFEEQISLTLPDLGVENKVYDGTTDADISDFGELAGLEYEEDDVELDTSGAAASFADKNVGAGITVTVTGLALTGEDAYKYSIDDQTTTANIIAKVITVTGAEATGKVYDGNTDAVIDSAVLVDVVEEDDVELDQLVGTFASAEVGAGIAVTAALTLKGDDAGNYTLTQPEGLTANITAKELTIGGTFTAADKEYDGNTGATIDDDNLTLEGKVGDDDVTLDNVTIEFDNANVSEGITVSITGANLSGNDTDNYTLSLDGAPMAEADINRKELTVTGAVAESRVYDGTTGAAVDFDAAELDGVVDGDDDYVNLNHSAYSADFAEAGVGTHDVTVTGLALDGDHKENYTLEQPTLSASITKKALTIRADNKSKLYGDDDPDWTVSYDGFVPGEDEDDLAGTLTFDREAGESAGARTITPGGLTSDNYAIEFEAGTLTINQRPITVTADPQTKEYGELFEFDGNEFSHPELVAGDEFTAATITSPGAAESAEVGEYDITVSDMQGTGVENYDITYEPGTLTVSKAVAEVNIEDITQTYDGTGKTVTVTTVPPGLTVEITYDDEADLPVNAGEYAVVATVDDTNYAGTASTTLTIEKAVPEITVQPTATNIIYGQKVGDSDLTGGDADVDGVFDFVAPDVEPNAGTKDVPVSFTPEDTDNYEIVEFEVSLTTEKETAGIEINDVSQTYDGDEKEVTVTTDPPDLNVEVTYNGGSALPVGAGDYSVEVTVVEANYKGEGTAQLTIAKADPVVTEWPTATSITYGQTVGDSTLDGGAAAEDGEFSFADPAETPAAGTAGVTVRFVPNDEDNFNTVESSVNLTTGQATLTVTGAVAFDKLYDTDVSAEVDFESAVLDGVIGSDNVTLDHDSYTAVFQSADVGTHDVEVSGLILAGNDAGNYVLAPLILEASITPVDKSALKALIDEAEALEEDDYTADSWSALEDAVDAAKKVYDDPAATVKDVSDAITELQEAIDGLRKAVEEILYGDVDGDGEVAVTDAILVLRHIVGLIDLTNDDDGRLPAGALARGLVSGEGTDLTVSDAILILRYIVGLIDYFPVDLNRDALQSLVSEGMSMEEAQYSADDWDALQEALAEGERVLGDSEATDEDIAGAARALRIALEPDSAPHILK